MCLGEGITIETSRLVPAPWLYWSSAGQTCIKGLRRLRALARAIFTIYNGPQIFEHLLAFMGDSRTANAQTVSGLALKLWCRMRWPRFRCCGVCDFLVFLVPCTEPVFYQIIVITALPSFLYFFSWKACRESACWRMRALVSRFMSVYPKIIYTHELDSMSWVPEGCVTAAYVCSV